MYPILSIGQLALPTYPFVLLIAYWLGLWVAAKRAKQLGLNDDHMFNAGLYALLFGIVGARVWFVLSHWEHYAVDLSQALSLSRGSLSFGEGLIIAGVVVFVYVQQHKISVGIFADAAVSGLAVALVVGHIGAFLGGVALGTPSDVFWAIKIITTARHPVQLYIALVTLGIVAVLYFIRHYHPWSSFHFWLFVLLYGTGRLGLEIFRARPTLIGNGFLANQVLALTVMVIALAVMAYNFNHNALKKYY